MNSKIPEHAERDYITKTFTAQTTPLAFLYGHRIESDVWALIVVERGTVAYQRLGEANVTEHLTPERAGVIEPGVRHRVTPSHDARFHLELYRTRSVHAHPV
jgi:tellurite resistance-related uncharacterized protein